VLVETHALTKRYGAKAALADCTLGVARGEVFGLLGPNGAGKTTLLRLLLGFLRPTAGRAAIDGLDCYRQSVAVHRVVAYVPGDVRLFTGMRGREVLAFFAGVRPGGDFKRSLDLAARLELDLTSRVAYMSTGMRQKLALAATLAADAPLLILDEPTSNLDPNVRAGVLAMVGEARKAGRTVIFSSHVLPEVEEACDRVVILRGGHVVHTQIMAELRRQHRIRARLTGPLPPLPAQFGRLVVRGGDNGDVTLETPDALAPLLGWLATLPLEEVNIEPLGLKAVYDHYHAEEHRTSLATTGEPSA
jgi:ABC-2 type transport system ATP-binding protein